MRVLRATLHHAAYRTQVAADALTLSAADDEPRDQEVLAWDATMRPDRTCPSHPRRFTVGPYHRWHTFLSGAGRA